MELRADMPAVKRPKRRDASGFMVNGMAQTAVDGSWGRRRLGLGWASLTESEVALAELVARGLTNRQAAEQLRISRHTVDAHLRHIYRKLDINSRVDLARLVAIRGLSTGPTTSEEES
jgi:DNA-binding CsgD family transcriptional regulator